MQPVISDTNWSSAVAFFSGPARSLSEKTDWTTFPKLHQLWHDKRSLLQDLYGQKKIVWTIALIAVSKGHCYFFWEYNFIINNVYTIGPWIKLNANIFLEASGAWFQVLRAVHDKCLHWKVSIKQSRLRLESIYLKNQAGLTICLGIGLHLWHNIEWRRPGNDFLVHDKPYMVLLKENINFKMLKYLRHSCKLVA